MYKFTSLGNEPKQEIIMLLSDNSRVTFNFEYRANQQGWFFGYQWGEYNRQNIRLTTNYNMLSAYQSYLPFGLRCDTTDFEEPYDIDDFINGYASLYLLTKDDVSVIETKYYTRDNGEVLNA